MAWSYKNFLSTSRSVHWSSRVVSFNLIKNACVINFSSNVRNRSDVHVFFCRIVGPSSWWFWAIWKNKRRSWIFQGYTTFRTWSWSGTRSRSYSPTSYTWPSTDWSRSGSTSPKSRTRLRSSIMDISVKKFSNLFLRTIDWLTRTIIFEFKTLCGFSRLAHQCLEFEPPRVWPALSSNNPG